MIIEPNTEKGKTQIETIAWCQEQINAGLKQLFSDKYRLQKGLQLEFLIDPTGKMDEKVKLSFLELAPTDNESFDKGVLEAGIALGIKEKSKIIIPK